VEPQDLENNTIVRKLKAWDPQAAAEAAEFRGELTLVIPREELRRVADFLKSGAELSFTFLSDITPTDHFPLEPRFEVNYHLLSLERRERLRLKVSVPGNDPVVPSVTTIWPGADWHEREAFDLFGLRFEGHPDLRRILMPDDWEGHPLRKDYPVEGYR
jgi:NADH-quinone oxidoreductase subunit C